MKTYIATILLCCFCLPALAEPITLGETYEIAEPDILKEIQARAAGVDWKAIYNKDPSTWGALSSPILPEATHDEVRQHKPVYIVEQDVIDRNGKVLYPKGYVYNPLQYITLPSRIIFIGGNPSHLQWLKGVINDSDMVIVSGADPITMSKKIGRPVFLLTEQWIERLSLRAVPAIVTQSTDSLTISEFSVNEVAHEPDVH